MRQLLIAFLVAGCTVQAPGPGPDNFGSGDSAETPEEPMDFGGMVQEDPSCWSAGSSDSDCSATVGAAEGTVSCCALIALHTSECAGTIETLILADCQTYTGYLATCKGRACADAYGAYYACEARSNPCSSTVTCLTELDSFLRDCR